VPTAPQPPLDRHELISFEDRHEQRTWVFDATFLLSNWSCIYGNGCRGILTTDATELQQGCCSFGAHFIDSDDVANTMAHVARLTADVWQHARRGQRSGVLAEEPADDGSTATTTRVVDGACIFLNRPGFAAGTGCALHLAALQAGERPLDWKPSVCWQVPVRLEHSTDDNGYVTSALREWKRRDWGAGGSDFHWWCTDSHEAFVGRQPVYQYLRDELIELVGAEVYDQLVTELERPRSVAVPHPAIAIRRRRG
jgi:hypothetical protein